MIQFARFPSEPLGSAGAHHFSGVELEKIDRFRNIPVGFTPRLPCLEDLPRGQLIASAAHDASRPSEYLGSMRWRCGLPLLAFCHGSLRDAIHISGRHGADSSDNLTRQARIARDEFRS